MRGYLGSQSLETLAPCLDEDVRITRFPDGGERDEDDLGPGNLQIL